MSKLTLTVFAALTHIFLNPVYAQTWNASGDFSTAANPSNNWSYGVIGGPNGSGFVKHPASASIFGFDYWWTNTPGQDNTARGFIIHNPSLTTDLNLTGDTQIWGASYVLKANQLAISTSMYDIADMQVLRWTAPLNGSYGITAILSGITYSGSGTVSPVSIAVNGNIVFTDIINGFEGSGTFSIAAFGSKPSLNYSDTLTLTAGSTVDIIKTNTALTGGCNAVGVDAVITLLNNPITPAMKSFDISRVRLLDGQCKTAQDATRSYLNYLDSDRLLYTMRATAGLPTPGQPLGGWEEPNGGIRGNILGHYLSACARMYAATGDAALKTKADNIVSELEICQQAIGTGFLFAAPPEAFTALENAQARIIGVPYYALHKLMAGLYDMYKIGGNQEALEILTALTDYFVTRFDSLTTEQKNNTLKAEFGGMTEVLYNLYNVTGKSDYARFGDFFNLDPVSGIRWTSGCKEDHLKFYESLEAGIDPLDGTHANTYIPEVVGTARRYEIFGNSRDRAIIDKFWDLVTNTRSYAGGGSGIGEEWREANKLEPTLGITNHETCATYNMLKLAAHLLKWTGKSNYCDFYERAFFNGIMGTQNPADGMTLYYLPMESGHKKNYGTPYDTFWCCTGSGMENFSQIGENIYFHNDDGVYVNLFIASTLDWQEKGLQIEQQTQFPSEDTTSFIFHTAAPVSLDLNVHIPYWATNGVTVSINDVPQTVTAVPSSYMKINRAWADGDKVEVRVPMSLHTAPLPDNPKKMAIMYGPLVLANASKDGVPQFLIGQADNLSSWITPVEGQPLTFNVAGQSSKITLIPLNKVVDETYGIYFDVVAQGTAECEKLLAEQRAAAETRTIDRVYPNAANSETSHNLLTHNSEAGHAPQGNWRSAADGWWSWDMKVIPNIEMALSCTYWGSDEAPRTFDILVDATVIATESLDTKNPNKLYETEYPIPAAVTEGKQKVTVKFLAHSGNIAGRVFGCATLSLKPHWNTARNYYFEKTQPQRNWEYGYKKGLLGQTAPFTRFPYSSGNFYMNFATWSIQDWWVVQDIYNTHDYNLDIEYWGSQNSLLPYTAYLGVALNGGQEIPVYRWTAPVDGQYKISANFWGAGYLWQNTSQATSSAVYVVLNDSKIVFEDTIDGFIGTVSHPAIGTKPTASYDSETVLLHTGDTVDFIATNNGNSGPDMTGVDGTIILIKASGDLTGNGTVDIYDLAVIVSHWLGHGQDGDLNIDNIIDFKDFAVIAGNWLM